MGKSKAVAPPEDRVQVYSENPHYIQYRGKPVFLFGCNQGWTLSLQDLDHDYRTEFDRLHEVGGNLVRITPFLPPVVDAPDRFDDRRHNYPWKRIPEGNQYRLDLDAGGTSATFWDRLADLVRYAYDRDIVVSFEFWDLYGPARGPGFKQGDRWSSHPFYPGNSPDLAGDDMLPAETDMKDIAFCRTVTRGGYDKALTLQEQYARRLLDVLSPYPNVIYCMVNETSAEKAWSDYWLRFTHRYFEEEWSGAPHLAGEMPREYGFVENFTVEDMIDDPAYWFADASQYFRGRGAEEARQSRTNVKAYYDRMVDSPEKTKPISSMKIYNWDGPSVIWMRLFAGTATARYHRHVAVSWFKTSAETRAKGLPPADLQLEYVGHVAAFLEQVGFRPWDMQPDHLVVKATEGIEETVAMCARDRRICAVLAFCEETISGRTMTLSLPSGSYRYLWYSPIDGRQTEQEGAVAGVEGELSLPLPDGEGFRQAVLYVWAK